MSRKAARQAFTVEDFKDKMEGKTWLEGSANKLLDEHPDSYKDIHQVMRDSSDLVEVVHELTQILNYKGT
jgi:tRNA-splicing ligase RtcB